MQYTIARNIADILVTALIAFVMWVLFAWWVGAVVLLLGLLIVLRLKNRRHIPVSPEISPQEEIVAGNWLEEWHNDMRRWQIGPYDQQD